MAVGLGIAEVPIKWGGDHEEALKMSATRSSIGLTTSLYCFGVLSPPYVVIVPAGPDHSALTPMEGTLIGSEYRKSGKYVIFGTALNAIALSRS